MTEHLDITAVALRECAQQNAVYLLISAQFTRRVLHSSMNATRGCSGSLDSGCRRPNEIVPEFFMVNYDNEKIDASLRITCSLETSDLCTYEKSNSGKVAM